MKWTINARRPNSLHLSSIVPQSCLLMLFGLQGFSFHSCAYFQNPFTNQIRNNNNNSIIAPNPIQKLMWRKHWLTFLSAKLIFQKGKFPSVSNDEETWNGDGRASNCRFHTPSEPQFKKHIFINGSLYISQLASKIQIGKVFLRYLNSLSLKFLLWLSLKCLSLFTKRRYLKSIELVNVRCEGERISFSSECC